MNPEVPSQAVRFAAPHMLWLLLGALAVVVLAALHWRTSARAQAAWAGGLFARLAANRDRGRDKLRLGLFVLGWVFVTLALARPQWGGELVMMKRRGIDLFVAIDVSTSMLAEDMRPNRLAQAKRAVADLIARMGGDRLGVIAFAGDAATICPLTLDHGTVLLMLESMNVHSVSTPGTNLEAAIRNARSGFVKEDQKHKALVLVTDGEAHEGDPAREAEAAAKEGLRIFTIGIGSPEGQPIPERDERGAVIGYKKDRGGNVVNSRLDEGVLQSIAATTGGRYYRSTPHALELGAVFDELQALEKKELEGQLATHFEERYQWPLALALLCLGLELAIPNRRRAPETA